MAIDGVHASCMKMACTSQISHQVALVAAAQSLYLTKREALIVEFKFSSNLHYLIKCEWLCVTLLAGKEKEKRHFFRNRIIHFIVNYFQATKSARALVYSFFLGMKTEWLLATKITLLCVGQDKICTCKM